MWHVPENSTERAVDLGVNAIRYCVYQISHCIVGADSRLSIAIGSLWWSFECFVSPWLL